MLVLGLESRNSLVRDRSVAEFPEGETLTGMFYAAEHHLAWRDGTNRDGTNKGRTHLGSVSVTGKRDL